MRQIARESQPSSPREAQAKSFDFHPLTPFDLTAEEPRFLPIFGSKTIVLLGDGLTYCRTLQRGYCELKPGPTWCGMSQHTCHTQIRLETILTCFWK